MNNLADLGFKKEEKQQLEDKIRQAVNNSGLDGIMAVDSGNFTYLTRGIVLPYSDQEIMLPSLVFFGRDKENDFIVCPPELVPVVKEQDWTGTVAEYSINDGPPPAGLVGAAAALLNEKKKIGIAANVFSQDLYVKFQKALPAARFSDSEDLLAGLRQVKTDGERRMLEIASRLGERALISAMNHAEGNVHDGLNYYLWEFGERIRVHVGEFGGSMTGNLSVQQGAKAARLYSGLDMHEEFQDGNFLRAEWTSQNYGFWASSARTLFIGEPGPAALQSYRDNLTLKQAAADMLKPGIPASEVFDAVVTAGRTHQIPFRAESGAGHGVGTSEMEGPYLDGHDRTMLKAGMVLVLAVYTYGEKGELICSKDTYEITDDGSRLLSWYKSYNDLYSMYGSSARHG